MTFKFPLTASTAVLTGALLSSLVISGAAAEEKTNWQGFYGGLAIGGAYGKAEPDNDVVYSGYFMDNGLGASDRAQVAPAINEELDAADITASALIGYDHQAGNMIYGIEGDVTWASFSESSEAGPIIYDTAPMHSFTTRTSVESDFTFSIRPKIGYAAGDFQFYVSAGPSVSRFKTTHIFSDTLSGSQTFSDSKTALGVSSSIGAAYALGNDWSLRGDYVFNYFPGITDGSTDFSGDGNTDFSYDADFQSHNIRLALIKRF
ncbi:outer membrane protein [Tepidicaulis sp. LMO-SS28]|uniref:outer membrane protein n=1 Tax=Tepidicaulis sp. LMO-SS28 TaxID=3447455 RepID=UPI003EDF5C9A